MYFLDILKFKKYLISFNKILKVLKISILMLDLIFLTLFIIMKIIISEKQEKKISFGKYTYELDSVCIIDNTRNHFCCLIHCNKQEYSYDGASNSRLQKMPWTHLLNTNNDFTFVYNNNIRPLYFNFLIGYSMLIYYRKS